jgi:hypothetical protein
MWTGSGYGCDNWVDFRMEKPGDAAILDGVKSVEVRSWVPSVTVVKPGQRILIHASAEASTYHGVLPVDWLQKVKLTGGAILGIATYTGCIHYRTVDEFRIDCLFHFNEWSDYREGLVGWGLIDPLWLPDPVPFKGQLGFFNAPWIPGVCRVCGCTEDRACEGGCSWKDDTKTICTRCAP